MSNFKRIKAVVLTISDSSSRGFRRDESGEVLKKLLKHEGVSVIKKEVVADEPRFIKKSLKSFCDHLCVDLVLTTGGTGLGPRDVTPEATRAVIKKEVPGLPELMRFKSFKKTERAALSRAIAGVRGKTLIVNLPGSPQGARASYQAIRAIIPHALAMIRGEGHDKKSHEA